MYVWVDEDGEYILPPLILAAVEFKKDGWPKKKHAEAFFKWLKDAKKKNG